MLTILNHHNQTGVSARQLHTELQPRSGFTAWFRHYKKTFKEGEEVFLLSPFLKGASGRHKHRSGDYLITIPAAESITRRSGSQLSEKVREKLYALAGKTPSVGEAVFSPPTAKQSSIPASITESDAIVALALRIQELTQQEKKLAEICQNLRSQYEEVQIELFMAKTDLRDLVVV